MTLDAIREGLAMLAQLKQMNPRRPGVQRIVGPPYRRSAEDQVRMDRIAAEFQKLDAARDRASAEKRA